MTRIVFTDTGAEIDAEFLARRLAISPDALQRGLRAGTITSRFEKGEGEDAGRVRLTFFSPARRSRIIADESGDVLSCVSSPLSSVRAAALRGPDMDGADRQDGQGQ